MYKNISSASADGTMPSHAREVSPSTVEVPQQHDQPTLQHLLPELEKIRHSIESMSCEIHQMHGSSVSMCQRVEAIEQRLAGTLKDWYTTEEFAVAICRTAGTVRRMIRSGVIHAERVSGTGPKGRLQVPRSELQKLLAKSHGGKLVDGVASRVKTE